MDEPFKEPDATNPLLVVDHKKSVLVAVVPPVVALDDEELSLTP